MEDIRKFALVVLDKSDRIIDRYDFDVVTNISGLGYKLKLSTIDTDIENYVTKIVQEKKQLSMTIIHRTGYSSANFFDTWCEKHINDVVCLEYYDTTKTLYIEGKVLETTKSEKNEFGVLEQQFVFQPLTPFFEKIDNDVRIQVAAVGKKYPFQYAYNYGLNQIENNSIKNTYIKDIPINALFLNRFFNASAVLCLCCNFSSSVSASLPLAIILSLFIKKHKTSKQAEAIDIIITPIIIGLYIIVFTPFSSVL